MAINFLGYNVEKLKWGTKFGVVNDSKTYTVIATSGTMQESATGGGLLGYPWSVEILTTIPTSVPFEDINFSLTLDQIQLGNSTIIPLSNEDFWQVTVRGQAIKPSTKITGVLQCDYSYIGEIIPGDEVNTLYFNNRLVYSNSIFSYSLLDDDTYEISYLGGLAEGTELVLPNSYNGKAVTRIGSFFSCPASIIRVPEGYTVVNSYAFEQTQLKELYLPKTLEYIYEYAFSECSSLQKIVINGCISIGNHAFDTCEALEYFAFPEGQVHIGNNVFEYCSNLKYIYIPESVLDIDGPLCSSTWSPRIYCATEQDNVVITSSSGSGAQGWYEEWNEGCSYVYYGWKVPTEYIYYNKMDGNRISISWNSPNSLPTELYIPVVVDGYLVAGIEANGFAGKNLYDEDISAEGIHVPHSVEYFGTGAFEYQTRLTNFEFQSETATLDYGILASGSNLSVLTAPFIGKTANSTGNESGLGYLFDSRSTIDTQAQYVPTSLDTIVINSDWSPSIGQYTICNCQYVFDFMLSDSVTTLYSDAFYNCGLQSFPVNQQYWRWELLDENTGDVADYGGFDIPNWESSALQKLKSSNWTLCYVHEPEEPTYSATRNDNKVTLVIHNPYSEKVKYATAYTASYVYGPGQASDSPNKTGEIPAYGNVTTSYTFPSTNSMGASLTGIASTVWFNDYRGKAVTKSV